MSGAGGGHILVVPFPAQGHLLPLLNFTRVLLPHGFSITILLTPNALPSLDLLPPTVTPLLLPFPSHPVLPPGVENTQNLPPGVNNIAVIHSHARLRDPLLSWFRSHPSPPAAIISDFFCGWTQHLAADLGIPRFAFYGVGAFFFSVLDWLFDHVDAEQEPNAVVHMPDLPGSPSFQYRELPSLFRRYIAGAGDEIRDHMVANKWSNGVVFNTFSALEGRYLAHVRRVVGHSRVWAVGPIKPSGSDLPDSDPSGVLRWLDGYPDDRVVYVCFGSQASLSPGQAAALGAGLERSGAPFVWAVKGDAPAGIEERAGGRGKVARGWAPQVAILNHRAVGAFVTHCGWNSVLEAVAAGVKLLAWPHEADQFVNTRLLVEELGMAVRVCEGADTVPDVDEVAQVVADSVGAPRAKWSRAAKMTAAAAVATADGGSSSGDLAGFLEELTVTVDVATCTHDDDK